MSGKLDQSLDEITTAQRRSTRARRPAQRRSTSGRPTPAAPVGGIQKSTKPARGAANKPALAKAAAAHGDSKVIVSNLVCDGTFSSGTKEKIFERMLTSQKPKDVTEKQIKVCFG
jgi:THO complex subunit 4